MDESNDPNDKGFAIVGHYAEGDRELIDHHPKGIAIVGEPGYELLNIPPGSTIYPNVTSNANGPARINLTAHVPNNSVCSGGGFPLIIMSNPNNITYLVPSSLHGWWQIVRAVAEKDSTYEYAGVYYCPYCDASQVREASSSSDKELSKLFPHDADCIVLKARAMIDAMPHVEAKNERVE